ncbi:hypothetical protein SEA_PAOLA_56 [Mycobacterium phage Paola]|uniref:Uncharacterized protein n=4 Tax=Kratiovirus TaxID=2948788 RepID=A0A345M986_9CAUD|nr:hypothetical protein SEA_GENGAR_56 [Mycobacterium phage Gengar]YP_009950768.1 hypothetical protein I5G73_gp43 [Mycobacterium phage Leston]YP_009950862.1 hypothetical protein I5G74_gp41 [Mycobacterium phage Paola]YP_009951048.1 hypothetical protein I5G76_gp42 [Mycobacterium phage Thyatira]AOQ28916.1 hypothetical protein SEA_WATERFOUL_58 [Mycobacterium phage Waterfoul]QXN73800.1 hypothetical protein SEA_SOSEPH_57 [Mycobacterium phage SoSeph]WNM65527.1 hypothetical protein SEA_HEFTYBOY_57 [My
MTAPNVVAPAGKPRVRRARTKAKRSATVNWIVEYGTLRLAYSSHAAAIACASCLRLWGMVTPLGLVGMHREVES